MSRLLAPVRVMRANARIALQEAVQYRASICIWVSAYIVETVVLIAVWQAVATARGGDLAGYDRGQLAGYFIVLMAARDLSWTWLHHLISGHVHDGTLVPRLLRPAHPVFSYWGFMFGWRTQRLMLLVPVICVLSLIYRPSVEAAPIMVAAAIGVVPAAIACRYMVDTLVSTVAFRTVRNDGVNGIYGWLQLFVCGQMVPIAALPGWMQEIARALPFYWMIGYPAELVVGTGDLAAWPRALATIGVWCMVFGALLGPAWRRGLRRYETVSS